MADKEAQWLLGSVCYKLPSTQWCKHACTYTKSKLWSIFKRIKLLGVSAFDPSTEEAGGLVSLDLQSKLQDI